MPIGIVNPSNALAEAINAALQAESDLPARIVSELSTCLRREGGGRGRPGFQEREQHRLEQFWRPPFIVNQRA